MAFFAEFPGRCARCGARFAAQTRIDWAAGLGPRGRRRVQHATCPTVAAPAARAALRRAVAAESAPAVPVVSLDTATAVGGTVATASVNLDALAATAAGVRRTAASYMTFMDTPAVQAERERALAEREAARQAALARPARRIVPPPAPRGPGGFPMRRATATPAVTPAGRTADDERAARFAGLELDDAAPAPAPDPADVSGAERFRLIELD